MLKEQIQNYIPYDEQEQKDKEQFLNFINTFSDVLTRDNVIGHFSSSAFVVNKKRTKMLAVYHIINDGWIYPGGHADGIEDLLSVAVREVEEETGLISSGLIKVGELYPSPGYTDEVIHLFFSENNTLGSIKRDKDEFMDLIYLDIKEAYALLDKGEIKDAKTQVLLYKLRDKLLK